MPLFPFFFGLGLRVKGESRVWGYWVPEANRTDWVEFRVRESSGWTGFSRRPQKYLRSEVWAPNVGLSPFGGMYV